MNTTTSDAQQGMGGFLGWVERSGNKLPDPVFLFFWLIVGLVAISAVSYTHLTLPTICSV